MQYHWTAHALGKIKYYRLSQQRVMRVIRTPKRVEEGIAENTIAVMQPSGTQKHPYEIWVMVQKVQPLKTKKPKSKLVKKLLKIGNVGIFDQKLKIISAWRYPGVTKPGDPLPRAILFEIEEAL